MYADEILQLARVKMSDEGMSFSEALRFVSRGHLELLAEHRNEVLKSTTVFEAEEPVKFTGSPAQEELRQLARDEAQSQGITFREALLSVCRARPMLASEYLSEVD